MGPTVIDTSKLRILVVHNTYRSGQPSGEDRVVEDECELLAGAGHLVTRFERHSDDIARMSLAQKVAVPLRVPWNPASRTDLAARLRAERPDVVHVHSTFPLLSPSVLAACTEAGVPVVASLHNYLQVCPSGTLYRAGRICTDCVGKAPVPAIRHGCYRGSRVATLPLAVNLMVNRQRWWSSVDRFFCLSEAQRRALVEAGMPEQRLLVKPNSVPDREQRGDHPGEHFLFLGRLAEEKGLRVLMEAWDHPHAVSSARPPLVMAGTGPLSDEVKDWASQHPDVRYLGMQTPAQCARLMARAAAVVAPSLWLEACPLVLLEATAAGVPMLAPRHGAPAEFVDDGVTGLLHRPGDARSLAESLHRIVASAETNRRMGRAARRRYQTDFAPDVGLQRLIAGYRLALDPREPDRPRSAAVR